MGYQYGHCSSGKMSEVNYTAQNVSRRGNTVRIDQAQFEIEAIEGNRMTGKWTLGSYSARKIFMKQ